MAEHNLDLRGVACPMNFVKTRLFLDKIAVGDLLTVLLDQGEPVESVSTSVQEEGHSVEHSQQMPQGHFLVLIKKS